MQPLGLPGLEGGAPAQVPFWQARIVQGCRKRGKPVIVATNMLESMITNPTPTRAEASLPVVSREVMASTFARVSSKSLC